MSNAATFQIPTTGDDGKLYVYDESNDEFDLADPDFDPAGTAASAVSAHDAETTSVHGITDTADLLVTADIGTNVQAFSSVLDATTASFTTADETKLDAIEALADVTDATNVVAALSGATLSDVGTPASTDKILLLDASDSDNLKYADFSEFGGGGGGSFSFDDSQAWLAAQMWS